MLGKRKTIFYLAFFVIVFVSWTFPLRARAAKFYFENSPVSNKQLLQIVLRLDSEGEEINALEGRVILPPFLEVIDIDKNNSIIPLWIEEPQKQGNKVSFAGIIPGGIVASGEPLFTLQLKVFIDREEKAVFKIEDFRVLLNDGKGTSVRTTVEPLTLTISPSGMVQMSIVDGVVDNNPPAQLTYQVVRDANLFDNQWVVIFLAQDKESGIAYYEVQENKVKVIDENKWRKAKSPYLLQDQSRQSYIFLRAVDKAGNYTLATIEPAAGKKWYESQGFLFILISGGVILLGLLLVIIFKRRNYEG